MAAVALQSQPTRSITLIGMMGAGKSTVGRRLAQRLDMPFFDADEEIEKAAGMTVSEIFETYGEDHFRDGEKRVIARLIDGKPAVIATGGGAFVNDETRRLILDRTTSIWLDPPLDTLVKRVARRDTRPLLKDRDPRTVLSELAAKRHPFYRLADIRVEGGDMPHDAMVDRILQEIGA